MFHWRAPPLFSQVIISGRGRIYCIPAIARDVLERHRLNRNPVGKYCYNDVVSLGNYAVAKKLLSSNDVGILYLEDVKLLK